MPSFKLKALLSVAALVSGSWSVSASAVTAYDNAFESGLAGSLGAGVSASWSTPIMGGTRAGNGWTLGTDVTPAYKGTVPVGCSSSNTAACNHFLGRDENFQTFYVTNNPESRLPVRDVPTDTNGTGPGPNNNYDEAFLEGRTYENFGLGNDQVALNLSGLGTHDTVRVTFDLFIIHSWNGSNTSDGPDFFDVQWANSLVGAKASLLHTTFSNHDSPSDPQQQLYSDATPETVLDPARSGAEGFTRRDSNGNLVNSSGMGYDNPTSAGNSLYRFGDSWYTLTLDIPVHTSTTLALFFQASGLRNSLVGTADQETHAVEDESWGIDNLKVETFTTAVPLPAPVVLLLSAIATGAGFVRRRKV